jgi:phosphatidate cytidylyltransferase
MSQGLLRVLTAVVGIPVLIGAAYVGSYWFGLVVAIIALVGVIEISRMLEPTGSGPVLSAALVLSALVIGRLWLPYWEAGMILVASLTILSTPGLRGSRPAERLAATGFVVVYPAWLLSFVVLVREGTGLTVTGVQGFWLTVMFFIMIWASDTFAYYTGRLVGRTPFFPAISPKKTWEGFLGGVAGTALAGGLIKQIQLPFLNWTDTILLILICAVIGPVGDLVESRIKRSVQAKDSGGLLPGHGGLLDRFDAMIVCAPLVWLYLAYLSGVR